MTCQRLEIEMEARNDCTIVEHDTRHGPSIILEDIQYTALPWSGPVSDCSKEHVGGKIERSPDDDHWRGTLLASQYHDAGHSHLQGRSISTRSLGNGTD